MSNIVETVKVKFNNSYKIINKSDITDSDVLFKNDIKNTNKPVPQVKSGKK